MSLLKECVIALLASGEDGTVRPNGLRMLGVAEAEHGVSAVLALLRGKGMLIEDTDGAVERMRRYDLENCYPRKGDLKPWLHGMLAAAVGFHRDGETAANSETAVGEERQ